MNWADTLQVVERLGSIEQSIGLRLTASGPPQAFIGELCEILNTQNQIVMQAEVTGFNKGQVFLMPMASKPVSAGFKVRATGRGMSVSVGEQLCGRIIDATGNPLDDLGRITTQARVSLHSGKCNPLSRQRIDERLSTGIHAIDCLLPIGKGQRVGLFAGSGVGKSVLLGMMTRHMNSDINVIALIGERGREVQDFIHNHLDADTLKKSIVVVACSDDFALMRRQAAYTATAIAEYFCSQGKDVMLFMDSVTRFAMAQREIGLSVGEPPTARGYTPSVFSLLPGLVERAGNFSGKGSITALYTVLVEGDDFNEPIADTMRSLLDGHIILTRELAQRGHYPAIDVLQSVSRLSNQLVSADEQELMRELMALLSLYRQNRDLIELGAWKAGQNPRLDFAVQRIDALNQVLRQSISESQSRDELLARVREIMQ